MNFEYLVLFYWIISKNILKIPGLRDYSGGLKSGARVAFYELGNRSYRPFSSNSSEHGNMQHREQTPRSFTTVSVNRAKHY